MDALFETLRSSTDNTARKAAAAQLRELQSQNPDAFLQHTYAGIASAELKPELRFFLCTLVLAFLDESWRSGVSAASQERFIALYVQLVVSSPFPSALLARKASLIVAVMARRGSRKAQLGELPPLVQHVVTRYVAELTAAAQALAYDRVCCLLLAVHIFLKEMQSSRVGHVFEDVCRAMVVPLTSVFSMLPDAASMLDQYDVCLYLFKCSLRAFGRAAFDPNFCVFLLHTTWRLAEGLGSGEAGPTAVERRLRLLEYALKILETTAVYAPSRLHELGVNFFVTEPETGAAAEAAGASPSSSCKNAAGSAAGAAPLPQSLFALLAAVVCSPLETVVSEKAVCRALRLFTTLLSAEDGDDFIGGCLERYAASPVAFPALLQHVMAAYLADVTTAEALAGWAREPERVAAEFDVDMDDAASPMSCAEQFFLAFTGSTRCAAPALAAAWAAVHRLLHAGEPAAVTAALHAIGLGYYTMASADNAAYLDFLRTRLLPLLQPDALALTSPFIARRVVWLVGMWCESVTDTGDRRAVLAALEAVLQHAVRTRNVVLVLVSLKATENFISDNNFALSDTTPTLVATVLQTVELLLTAVHSPTTIKELAGLVHVLIAKGAVQGHGDGEVLVRLFTPPAQAIIASYEAQANAAGAAATQLGMTENDGASEEGDAEDALSSLGMLLECLSSSVRQCSDDAVVWSLFPAVVQPCTTPTRAATAWAEDNAWELLLSMVQSSHTFAEAATAQALPVVMQHTHRDFSCLPLVFRTLYSLLLLREAAVDDVVAVAEVEAWVAVVRDSPSSELCGAVMAVLMVVARLGGGHVRAALIRHAAHALVNSADVQAETHTLPLAVALTIFVDRAASAGELQALLAELHAAVLACSGGGGSSSGLSALLEPLVLLLDVSPSVLVSRALGRVLRTCVEAAPQSVSAAERTMVQHALDGVGATAGDGASWGNDAASEAETRSPHEMLLEWLGDEDVPVTAPHVARLMGAFNMLL